MLIQPRRGLLQLAADLVLGEQIKYAGLDSAVLAHYRLRRWQVALASATENLPDTVGARLAKTPIPQMFQKVSVCGRKLAYVTAKFAALAPFGKVAALLSELLPISGAQNAGTVRNRTLRVGQEVVPQRPIDPARPPTAPADGPVVVGLDDGYV